MAKSAKRRPVFVDLCCGAGGMSSGFRRAGWLPLLGVDNSPHSRKTYEANIDAPSLAADLAAPRAIRAIRQKVGRRRLDAVIGGPPCQGFSRAGPRSVSDPRNELMACCARVAVALKPSLIVFENVPNLASPKFRPVLEGSLRVMRGAGYVAAVQLINARNFRVAQNRPRLLIVAALHADRKSLLEVLADIASHTAPRVTVASALAGLALNGKRLARSAIPNHEPMLHTRNVREKIRRIPPGAGPLSYRKLTPHSVADTMVCGHRALPCHYLTPRTITVREAARLQSFSDAFVFRGPRGNQMMQVANAVPPLMAAGVARRLRRLLG
jgi:DNA (cytosine-5)-methyltransferase 1